jgi:hypothetical protein
MKIRCKNCQEEVETVGFCRFCRKTICKNKFGWHHDFDGNFIGSEPFLHAATPGGKSPKKKKGKVAE